MVREHSYILNAVLVTCDKMAWKALYQLALPLDYCYIKYNFCRSSDDHTRLFGAVFLQLPVNLYLKIETYYALHSGKKKTVA